MASSRHYYYYCLYFSIFFLFIAFTYSQSSKFLSYEALYAGNKPTGRSLLQATKSCTVNMEAQNYTILTSRCKGPIFPAKVCCEALLEFCCPFVDQVNDLTTNCADTMFSYINLYGKYPPGLFANQCKGGKDGISCEKTLLEQEEKGLLKLDPSFASPRRPRLRSLALALAPAFVLYHFFF